MKPSRRQAVLTAMVEEARKRTKEGCSLREVVNHVAQVRDDMQYTLRHGIHITTEYEQEKHVESV
jgi:ribulose bisphosphate carboxylase small subunit